MIRNYTGFGIYDRSIIELLKSYKYEWTITDDVPFIAHYGRNAVPFDKIISFKGFKVWGL